MNVKGCQQSGVYVSRTALRAVAAYLRPRRRQAIWSVILGLGGTALLLVAKDATGFGQDVMINVGASVVMVALSFIVFDPIFDDMRKNAVEEHRTLNHDQLVANVAAARQTVEIMETWTGLLEERYHDRFLAAIRQALRAGVEFRILLLDPDSAAAEQRAEELHQAQVQLLIMENLRELYRLHRSLDPDEARRFQVRVYDASPSIQFYRWDDKAFISFFPIGTRAYDARQIEAFMSSPLGEFVSSRFEDLWGSATTRPMDDFMHLHLTVRLDDEDLTRAETHFIRVGPYCFIDGSAIADHLTDHGALRLSLATMRPLTIGEPQGDGAVLASTFDMVRVERNDRPRRAEVVAVFDAKYGDSHENHPLLRLVPRVAPREHTAGRLEA
jgi:hypothetical protein